MVTTRSKTNSLPAKRAATPEHIDLPNPNKPRKVTKFTEKDVTKPQRSSKSKTDPKHDQTKPTATFFDLPAELRNEIYSLVLATSIPTSKATSTHAKPDFQLPALLAVNRQIRAELSSMRAGEIVIHINGSAPAVKYLRGLAPGKLVDVREVCILSSEPCTKEWALQRIRQLENQFGQAGLRKYAVRFSIDHAGQRQWMSLYDLKRIEHLPKSPQKPTAKARSWRSSGVWYS